MSVYQFHAHNNRLSRDVWMTYLRSASMGDGVLLGKIDAMVPDAAPTSGIAAVVGGELGVNVTAQHIRNLVAGRLEKQTSEERIHQLLVRFAQEGENTCTIVQDQNGWTVAIMAQTEAQRAAFAEWGDCLFLDFIHNTNNLGYYLGASCAAQLYSDCATLF
ncbi:hypothetical protein PybrP1_010262 [[Pythium] brassicae (nom. inval.)]|nr:hypothetical protein PybrP1_010262 [[Pythium] brassicae (nom. inval.)]